MKAKVIKATKIQGFPHLTIAKDSIVEVIGTPTEDDFIAVRVLCGTEYEHIAMINVKDIEGIEEE